MTSPLASTLNLTYVYGDGTKALEDVSIEIRKGERVGIAGENGSGKTTLCKHLNGLLAPTKGNVLIEGRRISDLSISEISRKVGFLFQNPDNQLFCSKVSEEISFGLRNLGLEGKELADRINKYLLMLRIEKHSESPPLMLSFGLRRLVTIASVLAMEQDLIVLDEPTAWLDRDQSIVAINAIRQFAASGRSIIVVSHNIKLIAEFTDRTIILSHGKKIADGNTREIIGNPEILSRAGLSPTPVSEFALKMGIGTPGEIITEADLIKTLQIEKKGGASIRF